MGAIRLLRRAGRTGGFFVKQLGFSQEQAFVTFGAFLRWSMASFPLAAMSATTCWGQTHHCSRSTCAGDWLLHDRLSLLKPDLIFIALGTIAVGNACLKLTQPACFRSAIRRKIRA